LELAQVLEPGRDVDPVAVDPLSLDRHVPEVNANSEQHPTLLGQALVPDLQHPLHLDRALHRVQRGR
jgi:hypothetical protein